jgi:threonine/homoserine/homoserine lactone efflux protein
MITLMINAFILGLIGGVIPGPILASAFSVALIKDFKNGVKVVLWGMFNETSVAIFSLLVIRYLNLPQIIFNLLSVIGAWILFSVALKIWKIKDINLGVSELFSYKTISYMILTNGVLWMYWISVCIPQAMKLEVIFKGGSFLFLFLVEFGWLLSTLIATYLFYKIKRIIVNNNSISLVFKVFAIIFVYFSLSMLYSSFSYIYKYFS